jgi:hypothetical protein
MPSLCAWGHLPVDEELAGRPDLGVPAELGEPPLQCLRLVEALDDVVLGGPLPALVLMIGAEAVGRSG